VTDSDDKKRVIVGPYMDLGLQLAVAVLLGTALGYWIDSKLHSSPLFILIGVLLGAVAGFTNIYRTVYPASNNKSSGKGQ
jgi:ATP synthase protein I